VPPVQRRLSAAGVDNLCARYVSGSSIDALARAHGVNRTTIIKHLDQHGVPRRRVVRKMTDALVAEAATNYRDGHSLATVADDSTSTPGPWVESSARPESQSGRGEDGPTDIRVGAFIRPLVGPRSTAAPSASLPVLAPVELQRGAS
jgi:hypothetical protein